MKYFLILLVGFTLNSCELLTSCLDGNGKSASETRAVASFTNIYNESQFDVTVIYSDTQTSLTVEADENLLQYISTYVQSSSLVIEIDDDRCLESVNPVSITIECPDLESVVSSGSGGFDLYNFSTDNFSATATGSGDIDLNDFVVSENISMNSSGSGDITIDGKGAKASLLLSGSGDIDADRFLADNVAVTLSGSGDMSVYFISSLTGTLSGSGNIHYYGNSSSVQVRDTGSGDLIEE